MPTLEETVLQIYRGLLEADSVRSSRGLSLNCWVGM